MQTPDPSTGHVPKIMTSQKLDVSEKDLGKRLDQWLTSLDLWPTRSQIKAAIHRGEVRINHRQVKAGYRLKSGDCVHITLFEPTPSEIIPEPMDLNIVFEDQDLLVVDKPSGLVVHPGAGHLSGTLVHGLMAHCGQDFLKVGEPHRPGIVHRLDKDTSGLLVVAKNVRTHSFLAQQFSTHHIQRRYVALCLGAHLPNAITFHTWHGRHPKDRKRFSSKVKKGKKAITHVQVLEKYQNGVALVQCHLETGRTHQIRVHLSDYNAPILGDPIYGTRHSKRFHWMTRLALHADQLGFQHPNGQYLHFHSPWPLPFQHALDRLRKSLIP